MMFFSLSISLYNLNISFLSSSIWVFEPSLFSSYILRLALKESIVLCSSLICSSKEAITPFFSSNYILWVSNKVSSSLNFDSKLFFLHYIIFTLCWGHPLRSSGKRLLNFWTEGISSIFHFLRIVHRFDGLSRK